MQRPDEHLVGYTNRFSGARGQVINFKVSTSEPYYQAQVVKVSRSANPDDVVRERPVQSDVPRVVRGTTQTTSVGSFAKVDKIGDVLNPNDSWCISCWIYPTKLTMSSRQVIIGSRLETGESGFEIVIDRDGYVEFKLDPNIPGIRSESSLHEKQWYEVRAGYDHHEGRAELGIRERNLDLENMRSIQVKRGEDYKSLASISFGAGHSADHAYGGYYNGRLDDIRLYSKRPCEVVYIESDINDGALVAAWDFGIDVWSNRVIDRGPFGCDGSFVNMPTRAVAGHRWTGQYLDFQTCPDHYSAVHLHEDDLYDAGWSTDFSLQVPDDLCSGVYAVKTQAQSMTDYIPFVVLPDSRTRNKILVVLPVFTYLAYGNSRILLERDVLSSGIVNRELIEDPYLDLLKRHPEWGRSLYDLHSDGSGVKYASWHRPLTDVRPHHTHSATGSPRNFSADLCLVHWLEESGFEFDVITDRELDSRGIEALSPYRVVLTGSHPEYCTDAMLDALSRYTENGGRLMYLGGNGFYWVTSVHQEDPGVIEVRRGHCGTRPWTSWPGELRHSTGAQMGGLWRHRGRPPNELVGVGFTAQGWDNRAGYYVRTQASLDAKYQWIFDGVSESESIGDFGLVMDGAAGDEIDRYDPDLGGADFVILAQSRGHSDSYCLAVEEVEESSPNIVASRCGLVRSDIVYRDSPNTNFGAVFSVGSMAWVGALVHNDCRNNVSRITGNVLRRFSDSVE